MSKLVFNLSKAKVTFRRQDELSRVHSKPKPQDKRYVIYRNMGVAGKVLLFVYDKWERRYVYQHQAPIERGYEVTEEIKRMYRNHVFKDNITNEALFEF